MERTAEYIRKTKETDIKINLNIDGTGKAEIDTGIGFFDHMLEGFARHGFFDLDVKVEGDLAVDCHHTIEDTGIVLGNAIRKALKNKNNLLFGINFSDDLSCEILDNTEFGGRIARFKFEGVFEEILDKLGETPLPPYITEQLEDKERYQTVYSRDKGSAAAPTAGLHFTKELLQKVKDMGCEEVFVTLNIGLGTFRPVSVENIEDHVMHKEFYTITPEAADAINKAKAAGRRIVSVGTTAVRTLEAAATAGNGIIKPGAAWTDIFIYPGYKFKMIDALVTNFHLPQSTLLMLVSTLSTREIMLKTYEEAVKQKYRFFSFGDAMFITDNL